MSMENENQFGNLYSQYYDLLYRDKDYNAEVSFVDGLVQKYGTPQTSLLDLGCGTGKHCELFCDKGYKVHGVDMSADMLSVAEKRRAGREDKMSFELSDICEFSIDESFETVVSLFHVMSYQNTNANLLKAFQTAKQHLKPNGIFIFDFWYGPGVLTDLPTTRVKRLEDDNLKVTRLTESNMHAQQNVVDVNFTLFLENKLDKTTVEQTELHHMRYFFDTELELLCDQVGFEITYKSEWLNDKQPGFGSWNVVWVVKNI